MEPKGVSLNAIAIAHYAIVGYIDEEHDWEFWAEPTFDTKRDRLIWLRETAEQAVGEVLVAHEAPEDEKEQAKLTKRVFDIVRHEEPRLKALNRESVRMWRKEYG